MHDEWDEKTVVSADVAAQAPSGRKRARLIVLAGGNVGEMYEIAPQLILGRGREADVRLQGDGISRKHAWVRIEAEEAHFEDLGSTNGSFVNGTRVMRQTLVEGDKIQIGTGVILKFTFHDEMDEDFQRQMFESASRDALTQVYNKRFFLEQLDSEFAFSVRHKSDLSLMMFDLDHFKLINDNHGHVMGDYVLSELTRIVTPSIRIEDTFARYGGEEFVVLSRCEIVSAGVVGERLRKSIEEHRFVHEGVSLQVTVSVGVDSMPNPRIATLEEFIAAADRALYEAKRLGRNRVVCAGHPQGVL
jgi:two-component system cell cycle response regulator